jgi:hypothetical protein
MNVAQPGRVWELTLLAPCPWLTSNTFNGPGDMHGRARLVRKWRQGIVESCRSGKLPTGDTRLDYISVLMTARFRGRPPVRDGNAGNLDPTKKAVLDGLGPSRTRKSSDGTRRTSPGWGLIPDDSDKHVASAAIVLGEPLPATVIRDHPGLLIVRITELIKQDTLF